MVIKLIKRELSDSARSYIPVIVCILLSSILLPIQLRYLETSFVFGILNFVIVIMVFTIFILSIRASFYILYTNLYNRSGYELFTLPVKLWEIMVSKVLTLVIWGLIIGLTSLVSFFLFASIFMGDVPLVIEGIRYFMAEWFPLVLNFDSFLILVNLIVSGLQMCILVFFAGSIANSSYFSRNRAWFAFLFVFLISWVVNVLVSSLGLDFSGISLMGSPYAYNFDRSVLIYDLVFTGVLTGLFFVGTLWFWDNKLEIMN